MQKRLYRSRRERVIAGVCGGLADYFSLDPTLVRLIWIVLIFGGGSGLLLYLLAALIIPEEPRLRLDEAATGSGEPQGGSGSVGPGNGGSSSSTGSKALLGLILVGLGLFFLMRNLFPYVLFFRTDVLWPSLLVLVGVVVLAGGLRRRD